MPRRRSSAQRSGSIPVSARTSVDLPWSTWPAVAMTCMRLPCTASTAAASASSASGGSARRSSRQRPRSRRPSTAGSPARSAAGERLGQGDGGAGQRDAGRAAAADGRPRVDGLGASTPAARAAGPPAAPPGHAARTARRRGRRRRRGRPAQGGLHRGEGQLVHAQRAGQRVPAQARDQVGAGPGAEQQPGLRAAEQLVAGRGHERGAAGQRRRRVRLVGQQGVRGEQAGADVGDDRHAERRPFSASSSTSTARVKPVTTKFDGCTLRTNAVSGPTASA